MCCKNAFFSFDFLSYRRFKSNFKIISIVVDNAYLQNSIKNNFLIWNMLFLLLLLQPAVNYEKQNEYSQTLL